MPGNPRGSPASAVCSGSLSRQGSHPHLKQRQPRQSEPLKLPSIHKSKSSPQLAAERSSVAESTNKSAANRSSANKSVAASVDMESLAKSRAVRRNVQEVLTQPDVKKLALRYYEAQIPDRTGRLGMKELRRVLRSINEKLGVPLPTTAMAEQLFRRYDFNGDGCLNFDEFYELFVSSLRRFAFDRSAMLSREVFVTKEGGKVWDNYDCLKKLGAGSFGACYLVRHKRTGDERVVKAAGKSQVTLPIEDVEREIMVMQELDHPHVVRLYGWYEGSSSIYLVLDALTGGTLREVVLENFQAKGKTLPEDWIRTVMRQSVEAMAYCHSRRVIHKDLKDENIMLLRKDPDYQEPHAVIIDLGVSEMFGLTDPTGKLMAGTPTTMAPEVWTGHFGPKCDVWSLGCVLFELIAGDVPFCARSFNPADWRALHKRGPNWSLVRTSPQGKDCCSQMLRFNEAERPTMKDLLNHKWFGSISSDLKGVSAGQLERLQAYCEQTELKRALMMDIASRLPMQHAERVIKFFQALDENRDGSISKQELANGFRKVGLKDASLLDTTFRTLDVDGDGILSLNEFAAGVMVLFSDLLEERFRALFRKYDEDSNGVLDRSELAKFVTGASYLVANSSHVPAQQIIDDLLKECGEELSYEEAKSKLLVTAKAKK